MRENASVGRYRYVIVAVAWLTFCIGAFDRANISVLIVDPAFLRDTGLEGSPERQGLLMTALLLPYALSNIFLSPMADRWGAKRVLSTMAGIWSLVAIFMGCSISYTMLLAGRVIRGTAEGPLFPLANRYIRNWFPPWERGLANAIWNIGQRMGLALAVPLMTATIALLGWRFSFLVQAVLLGLVVLPAVWFLTADRPELLHRVSAKERAYIVGERRGQNGGPPQADGSLRTLLRNPNYWLAVSYHISVLAFYFGLTTWLPKYLMEARGFDIGEMVFFASIPHVCTAVSALFFGVMSDRLNRRAIFCTAGLAGAGVSVCFAVISPVPMTSALLVILGLFFWGMATPAYYAIMQRIIPAKIVATGIGIDNGISNFGSAMAPLVVGFLIGATGSYLAGLLLIAAVAVVGSLAALVLVTKGY